MYSDLIKVSFVETRDSVNLDHKLSVSKVKTFDSCKAKYKFSYIEKLPKKEWDFHVFGTFLHDTLENFHKKLVENAKLANLPDGANKNAEQESLWSGMLKECFNESIKTFNEKLTKEQKNNAFTILKQYLQNMRDQLSDGTLPDVIDAERDFYLNINDKVLLNGFIDRIQVDHDGVLHVADYKTTKDKRYLKDFFQLETYAYILFLSDPNLEKLRASFICLRHDCSYITKEYKRKDVEFIGEKFLAYADSIDSEKLWRPEPQFLCKYCDFIDNCPSGESYLVNKGIIEPNIKFGMGKW